MNRSLLLILMAISGLLILSSCGSAGDDDDSSVGDDDDTTSGDDDDTTSGDDDDSSSGDDDDSSAGDDDDSSAGDDDDSSAGDDDDSSAGDDDDSSAGDDDDSAAALCSGPENVVTTVELTDSTGSPSTILSATTSLTLVVSVENTGGVANSYWFTNGCLATWALTNSSSQLIDPGPMCTSVMTERTFVCPVAQVGGGVIHGPDLSAQLTPGTYDLAVSVANFGTTHVAITVQ